MQKQRELRAELRQFQDTHLPPDCGASSPVQDLLYCIHDHVFDTKLNVKTLKSRCRMRDHNVSCRFKHEVGASMKEYIETLRLDAAFQLLETGPFSAAEVGQVVGYCHLQTFYRAFARRFRCTPGGCRGATFRAATGPTAINGRRES